MLKYSTNLNSFSSCSPLLGKKIVVTRTQYQSEKFLSSLCALGADAYELPTIRIAPIVDKTLLDQAIIDIQTYDWIIFTSANSVEIFFKRFSDIYHDSRNLDGISIATIGNTTASKIQKYGHKIDLIPDEFIAESLITAFKQLNVKKRKILFPRAAEGREILIIELEKMGAIVDAVPIYKIIAETEDVAGGIKRFREEGADMITFTSASTAKYFQHLGLPFPEGIKTASIGPITSLAMRKLGLPVDVEAIQHDTLGLLKSIQTFYQIHYKKLICHKE